MTKIIQNDKETLKINKVNCCILCSHAADYNKYRVYCNIKNEPVYSSDVCSKFTR